jgi:UDPglucose 6-dehydrogenase
VTKSTVPVGTGDEVERIVAETRPDADVAVVSNPEFLREGAAIQDFKHPDRIVVGTSDERAKKVMTELYRPLYLNQSPMLFTTRRTAELIKYAANAFLATKITFINEVADLCEKVGADVQQVARGIGLDNRIGSKFLHAGPGFGGSCFPKDTVALIKTAQDAEAPLMPARLGRDTPSQNTPYAITGRSSPCLTKPGHSRRLIARGAGDLGVGARRNGVRFPSRNR